VDAKPDKVRDAVIRFMDEIDDIAGSPTGIERPGYSGIDGCSLSTSLSTSMRL
jgi:hypothetical protein